MSSDNKRVAKNAVALTFRMILVTIVGLYTSRIVLEALGVDDYGIYGVIGGVVGLASFLNTSMAGATSRFITFELGRGNEADLNKIFSTSLQIHLVIAVIVAVLAETIGLWFVNSKMNFPIDRMFAVNILYQFTIVSMIVSFTQVPYTSAIIAHEKMNIYAYFEIMNVVLKLIIVYILLIANTDKLILYGAMTLCVSVLTALIYRIYCLRNFPETKFKYVKDKRIYREMLAFSGYDLYGNMCVVAKSQGTPIILNIFFGVIANAGASLANTVTGVLRGFTSSVMLAFRPQIIKLYSAGDIKQMQQMMSRSMQISLLIFGLIAIPFMLETTSLLRIWLGTVPPYAAEFIRLILITIYFDIMVMINNTGIHATGNIRKISFISGTLYLLCPVISWYILKYHIRNANVIYIVELSLFVIITFLGWYFLKVQINGINIQRYIWQAVRSIVAFVLSLAAVYVITDTIPLPLAEENLIMLARLLISGFTGIVVLGFITFGIAFDKSERQAAIFAIRDKFNSLYQWKK